MIALGSVVLATTAARAGPPPDPETERLLAVVAKAEATPAWLEAVRALKAGTADQRTRADTLDRLARERHAAWTAAGEGRGSPTSRRRPATVARPPMPSKAHGTRRASTPGRSSSTW